MPSLTLSLAPSGDLAMQGNHYPITELGIKRLVERVAAVAKEEMQYGECEVVYHKTVEFHGRSCTVIEVTHPVPRPYFQFHVARIYIDDELQLPIGVESYDWPATDGDDPILKEQYAYLDLKMNVGFTDADFDPNNPEYLFPKTDVAQRDK
jgi:hypothetical protein